MVRVIVPGLRHFYRRFGPGRLYDAPVALGFRKRPTRERDLNPLFHGRICNPVLLLQLSPGVSLQEDAGGILSVRF